MSPKLDSASESNVSINFSTMTKLIESQDLKAASVNDSHVTNISVKSNNILSGSIGRNFL